VLVLPSWAREALLLAVVVSVAACGGGDGGGAITQAPTGADPQPPAVADTQAPTVAITAPANFASGIADTLTFSADATDNVAVASVEVQVDGIAAGVPQTTAPYSVSIDTNGYASGQHVLRVRASDAAGNQSAWDSRTVSFGGSRASAAGFTRNTAFITGLSPATAFAQAPDGRLFVAEQAGALRVVKNGVLLPTPFLTLTVTSTGERGLLGVAFHPDFTSNNFVYVYYTATTPNTHNRISRFTANGDVVVPGSELPIADLPVLGATNHNGGAIHFGADGKLYAAVGDNAVGTNSQSLLNPLGKLLRFNDDGMIPSDNPFFGTTTGLSQAIWALGLRNPFTFAVQPGTGRIHINDVGEGTWEEINLGAAGANYGWPTTEGPALNPLFTGPLLAYRHSATTPPGSGPGGFFTGCAIAGGTFYPNAGPFPPAYRGNYFFADLCTSFVARLDLANGNAVYSFGAVPGNPVDMLVADDGALLVLTRDTIVRFSAP
jgi:glucose/arabinose dehydrogenase